MHHADMVAWAKEPEATTYIHQDCAALIIKRAAEDEDAATELERAASHHWTSWAEQDEAPDAGA